MFETLSGVMEALKVTQIKVLEIKVQCLRWKVLWMELMLIRHKEKKDNKHLKIITELWDIKQPNTGVIRALKNGEQKKISRNNNVWKNFKFDENY